MWRAGLVVVAVTAAVWTAFGIVAAAFVASLGTYFVARRSTSGSIRTTDAATLWAESKALRLELRDRVKDLEGENQMLRERVKAGEEREQSLRERVAVLENEVRRLGGQIID